MCNIVPGIGKKATLDITKRAGPGFGKYQVTEQQDFDSIELMESLQASFDYPK